MKNKNNHDNWATPKYVYDFLDKEFNFDFDPCPLNPNEITEDKNGLLISWGKRNFVNPPYSAKGIKDLFILKGIEEAKKGNLSVFLIPVATGTKNFHECIFNNASEIRFLKGRINFEGINSKGEKSQGSGIHDLMIVIFNNKETTNKPKISLIEIPKPVKETSQLSLFEVN